MAPSDFVFRETWFPKSKKGKASELRPPFKKFPYLVRRPLCRRPGDAIAVADAVVDAAAAPELRGAHPAPLVVRLRLDALRRRPPLRRRHRRRREHLRRPPPLLRQLLLEPVDHCATGSDR